MKEKVKYIYSNKKSGFLSLEMMISCGIFSIFIPMIAVLFNVILKEYGYLEVKNKNDIRIYRSIELIGRKVKIALEGVQIYSLSSAPIIQNIGDNILNNSSSQGNTLILKIPYISEEKKLKIKCEIYKLTLRKEMELECYFGEMTATGVIILDWSKTHTIATGVTGNFKTIDNGVELKYKINNGVFQYEKWKK